ncbi:hypothetical protein ZIOFF_046497 [Zingiber officinale]|uniref:Uncharacterized protein n=1 Tax=Zingiber officinale TaxID=94328 RepID=A0A8J5FQ59_ZINOF|nr:hypothetical protein ZIOFF_046497 [Zingiber officinale]
MTRREAAPLLPAMKSLLMDDGDEIRSLRSCLRWMCLDQSNAGRSVVSWVVFLVFGVAVPAVSHFVLSYRPHRRPYDLVVQLSLSAASALSFISLSASTPSGGLRRFIFLDKVAAQSARASARRIPPSSAGRFASSLFSWQPGGDRVRGVLAGADVVGVPGGELPCGLRGVPVRLPPPHPASAGIRGSIPGGIGGDAGAEGAPPLEAAAQGRKPPIPRLHPLGHGDGDGQPIRRRLGHHPTALRRQSLQHRRARSQFPFSLPFLSPNLEFPALKPTSISLGNSQLCSIVLVAGLLTCLRSAAKITHKAQALTSHAAKWHVCATIESYAIDPETPCEAISTPTPQLPAAEIDDYSDDDEGGSEEDELEDTKIVPTHAHTISFQQRQALVTYLENNRAGITIFGFTVDRTWLHTVFMLETSLFLWLLGKTIGIS